MRKSIAILLLGLLSLIAGAQDKSLSLRGGYSFAFAPYGVWSDKVSSLYANNDLNFYPGNGYGLTFDTEYTSTLPFMNYRFGMFYQYGSRYDYYEDDNQISEAWIYLTGAGIYFGVTFRAGWEHFGIYNTYTAGFFSFDYRFTLRYYSNLGVSPAGDNGAEAVSGPGGKFELGLYGKYHRIGLYPSVQLFYTHNRQSQAILMKTINISAGYTF